MHLSVIAQNHICIGFLSMPSGKGNSSTISFSFIHVLLLGFSMYVFIISGMVQKYKCSSRSFFPHIAAKALCCTTFLILKFIPYLIKFTTLSLNEFWFIFVFSDLLMKNDKDSQAKTNSMNFVHNFNNDEKF